MSKCLIFVLGCDLHLGGNELGPRSIARLVTALQIWGGQGGDLVFAMGRSHRPEFRSERSGAELMADWVHQQLGPKPVTCRILEPEAGLFNTVGEVGALYQYLHTTTCRDVVVVTGRYQLPRAMLIMRRRFGRSFHKYRFDWRAAEGDQTTAPLIALEIIKYPYLYLSDNPFKRWLFRTFNQVMGNSSWR